MHMIQQVAPSLERFSQKDILPNALNLIKREGLLMRRKCELFWLLDDFVAINVKTEHFKATQTKSSPKAKGGFCSYHNNNDQYGFSLAEKILLRKKRFLPGVELYRANANSSQVAGKDQHLRLKTKVEGEPERTDAWIDQFK